MQQQIIVTDLDFERLEGLIENYHGYEKVEQELKNACVVAKEEVPKDVVTMNSEIEFMDQMTNSKLEATLVYPTDVTKKRKGLSVSDSLGSKILGRREGDNIEWVSENGITKFITILKVVYQPEANGDWDL